MNLISDWFSFIRVSEQDKYLSQLPILYVRIEEIMKMMQQPEKINIMLLAFQLAIVAKKQKHV